MEDAARLGVALAVVAGLCVLPWLNWLHLLPHCVRGGQLPKGRLGWPLIGETLDYIKHYSSKHPEHFFTNRIAKYGSIFLSHLLGSPVITVTELDDIKTILSQDVVNFAPYFPRSVRVLTGEQGLIHVWGDEYKELRRLVVPFLIPEACRRHMNDIEQMVLTCFKDWENKTLDAFVVTEAFAFNVIGKVLLSLDPGSMTEEYAREFDAMREGFKAFPYAIPGTAFSRALKSKKNIYKIIGRIISGRRNTGTVGARKDMLDCLLTAQSEDGTPKYSESFIADQVNVMLVAGVGTSATQLSFLLKYLVENPDVVLLLKEEHDAIRSRIGRNAQLTWEDYRTMSYTQKVINETLRMVSSVAEVSRAPLKDVKLKGFVLPKGVKVMLVFKTLHSDPQKYSSPDKFDPSRWENPKDLPLLAFGLGPRSCVGMELAKLEMAIFVHHLVTNFRLGATFPIEVTCFPFPSFPKGLPVSLIPLQPRA